MNYRERVYLAFIAVFLSMAGIGLIILGVPLVSFDYIRTSLELLQGNILLILPGVFFLIVSVLLFFEVFKKKKSIKFISQGSPLGEVRISFSAVESLVLKIGYRKRGIKDIKTKIVQGQDGLTILLKLIVLPDTNIPEITEKLQESI
ncbi:MAG: hypothetical protein CVU88_05025, partial [Firmicutes bacterium HGW-Firmicutes-13]